MSKTPEEIVNELAGNVTATLNAKLDELVAWKNKHDKQMETVGKVSDETKNALGSITSDIAALNAKMTETMQKASRRPGQDTGASYMSPGAQVVNSEQWKAFSANDFKGRSGGIPVILGALTSSSDSGGAVVAPDRRPGIIGPGTETLSVRSLIAPGQTTSNVVDYVKESGFTNNAKPVAEGDKKPESVLTFSEESANVRTIAHYIPVSKQILSDAPSLQSYIDSRMLYGLAEKEEYQLINGDGTGVNLNGLIKQATAYNTDMNKAGDTMLDQLANAILQVRLAHFPANGIYMNPYDVNGMRLVKDTTGRYIFADPASGALPMPWGMKIVETLEVPQGSFLVGAFNLASQIFDRESATVDISEHNENNFVTNKVTIRVEERLAFAVYRPEAIIKGTFISPVQSGGSGAA